jgi:single-strand DNA-binding protein
MNKFITSGRVANDVEIRKGTNGKTIARFNFAVRKNFKKDNEPDADFFNCIVFGKLAEVFEKTNVSKGTKLILEGEMRNDNYEKDGVKHYGMQYVVNSMEFCESKNETSTAPAQAPATPAYSIPDDFEEIDTDLPF